MFTREAKRGFENLRRYVDREYPNVIGPEWTTRWTPPSDPWITVEVSMIPEEKWAIWRSTGAVHRFQRDPEMQGAVEDDPIEFPLADPEDKCSASPGYAAERHSPQWEYEMGSLRPVGGWCQECGEGLDPAKGPDYDPVFGPSGT